MFRIEGDKAIFEFKLEHLWYIYDHLPYGEDGCKMEIWMAIEELEERKKVDGL
jgi:hypothetical protein